jgi:hypothetical protein
LESSKIKGWNPKFECGVLAMYLPLTNKPIEVRNHEIQDENGP